MNTKTRRYEMRLTEADYSAIKALAEAQDLSIPELVVRSVLRNRAAEAVMTADQDPGDAQTTAVSEPQTIKCSCGADNLPHISHCWSCHKRLKT